MERIGRIKQKNPKASKQYKITVEKDDKSGMATLITWKHEPKADTKDTFPGVYCLRTSHNDWDENILPSSQKSQSFENLTRQRSAGG